MKLYAFLNNTVNKHFRESDALHGLRDNVGYANGYVAVPPEHPLHGRDYNFANDYVEVHGGLTFGAMMEEIKADGWRDDTEGINIDKFDDIPQDYWVFGFDTMHYDDGPFHNREWCINETKGLMEQLENIKEL